MAGAAAVRSDTAEADETRAFLAGLAALLGEGALETALERRVFFSTDIALEGEVAECVIRPGDRDTLAAAVTFATAHGRAIVPRGGGFSYTGGYRPARARSVIVDMRGFDRIVRIDAEDMFVTVECGCTWKNLYEALRARGLRTPYFGPMSGFSATVGGALSQGSFFLGSTQYGTAAESVLALEVVLADGSCVRTGSAAGGDDASPFFRYYGPDLTGLFLGDTGAFGLKTQAMLRLIPWPAHQRHASFALTTLAESVALVSAIGRAGIAAECYAWDPTFVRSVGENSGLGQNLRYLAGIAGSGRRASGLLDAARIALAGRRAFDGSTHLVHVAIDDATAGGAQQRLHAIRRLARDAGARETVPTAPRSTRGTPFTDFRHSPKARAGVRSLPTHGIVPHSRAAALTGAVEDFFAREAACMAAHEITHGIIAFAVGGNAVCIEPLLFVTDTRHMLHDRIAETSALAELAAFGPPPAQAVEALRIRHDLIAVFADFGAAHVQIGKTYPYRPTRSEAARALLDAVKCHVDPGGLMNPGALGFDV